MDEGNWNQSATRVHPGYLAVFLPGEQRQQQIVNNGKRRKSAGILPPRCDSDRVEAGKATHLTFATKDDVICAKTSHGGKRIMDIN